MRLWLKYPAVTVLAACLALPPLGACLAGRALAPYYDFPPRLEIPDYPEFSWWAVSLIGVTSLAVAWPWLRRRGRSTPVPVHLLCPRTGPLRRFPWWGWLAVGWTLSWWVLAWTRFPWFAWAQRYTFTPLWLGFIVGVNGLTWRRLGHCLLIREPASLSRLFIASAAFWWVFEYLNRFVRNWHYLGAQGVGALEYAVHASICFSTVLPAVASMREWLGTLDGLQTRLADGPPWPWLQGSRTGAGLVAAALAGLALTGAQPVYGYAALWSAPLLLAVGLALRRGKSGWWSEVAAGDWRAAGTWALAAVGCGFFWELWNLLSFAKWIYTVPFVQRGLIFEMPLLGYTGYLTFGLECAIAVDWMLGHPMALPGRSERT
ncbi:MAG: hypothetical protein PHQ04_12155 [Opitutaceae bacterium]|nr:hypothetical protein [Opitutaceae bacterium]